MNLDDLRAATAALPSTWISEVVLQTGRYDEMKPWYEAVLGQPWSFVNVPAKPAKPPPEGEKQVRAADVRACFMRLAPGFPHGGTLALFEVPGTAAAPTRDPGLNHMQFKNRDLETLMKRIELLRDAGIHPQRCANHGPVLSFYFKDADRNVVEFCINNFDTAEEMMAFTRSERFQKNPSGLELDRDEFLKRYRSGEPPRQLLSI
jgi:catechol 2,3-dioxygenase-like lactoylglutathione lyase family enzyme